MLKTVGLFAGIGGFEEGLRKAGFEFGTVCEVDEYARSVLRERFPGLRVLKDVREVKKLPHVDLVTAGFPCQDLSQAGRVRGMRGSESRLVKEVFRLVSGCRKPPRWLLLENVPFMLSLRKGRAMYYVTKHLEDLGYTWAYRVIDTRAFGLPQRRKRVLILASRQDDPRAVLLSRDAGEPAFDEESAKAFGFYWTEGNTGVGWAVDAVPALKTGSGLSIASPPAIWFPKKRLLVLPDIRDAERLQGFEAGWTRTPKIINGSSRQRWRLVGNAIPVPMAKWIAESLTKPIDYDAGEDVRRYNGEPWTMAGWGHKGKKFAADVSSWPVRRKYKSLHDFLKYEPTPLSAKATAGFLSRARASNLNFHTEFLKDVAFHLRRMKKAET